MIRELFHAIGRMFAWFVSVAPWEQALRVRFGRHVRLLGPGFYVRFPFVDRVYRQSVRRRLSIIRPQTVTTKDGKAISLSGSVGYSVSDLRQLYNTLHDASDTIEAEVCAKVSDYVARHTLDECTPSVLEAHVRSTLDLERYGLDAKEFYISNFAVVRTFRLITGEFHAWSRGDGIDTSAHDDAPAPR